MGISPEEAEDTLAAIETISRKTRRSIASGAFHVILVITGSIWLIGYTCTQFLPQDIVGNIWIGISILGSILGSIIGSRASKRVRSPSTAPIIKRVGIFWLLLIFFAVAVIGVAQPSDGKQATLMVILFIMLGWLATGLMFSFFLFWWVLPITALALISYFLLPDIFYLLMGVLGGGSMILFGVYIRLKWQA